MKVSGFSFIKNAVRFQYPIEAALRSILPLCDEVVVAVGRSDDGTRELVAAIDPKIRIIDSDWDESLRDGGRVLASETNKAFHEVSTNADWCIYIQGDEVLHEDGYAVVREAMEKYKDDQRVDGLLFKYRHFYGSYDHVGISSKWYRNEIRVIRNQKNIYSWRDAQGFRKDDNEKLNVKAIDAYIHHYGWVREPEAMSSKNHEFGKFWNGEIWKEEKSFSSFDYSSQVDGLEKFTGSHPAVMKSFIEKANWKFDHDPSFNKLSLKEKFKNWVEKLTGRRPFDHNNYRVV
jgi:hypothetical protein